MIDHAFISWVATPCCKSMDSAMQSLNKAWQRSKTSDQVDEKVVSQVSKAIVELRKTGAAFELSGLDLCANVLNEIVDTLQAFQDDRMPVFGFDAISYALVRLPTYVRLVANGAPDMPAALFDVYNCCLLVNGKSPNLVGDWMKDIDFSAVSTRKGNKPVSVVAEKGLEFIDTQVEPTLRFIHEESDSYFLLEEFERILKDIEGTSVGSHTAIFTWLLQGVLSNAKERGEPVDLLTTLCIGKSCDIFRCLFEVSAEQAEEKVSEDFLYLLLVILSYSSVKSAIAESIEERLNFSGSVIRSLEVDEVRNQLGGADLTSLENVYPLLLDQLNNAIRGFNLATTSGRFKLDQITNNCGLVAQVASTLEVVGDSALAGVLRKRQSVLSDAVESEGTHDALSKAFEPLVETILFTRKAISEKIRAETFDIFEDLPVDRDVIYSLLKETRSELRVVRQKLGIHYKTGEAHEELVRAVRKLAKLSSSLTLVDLGNTSTALRHLAIFIYESIKSDEDITDADLMLVATALTAVEMRLEYLSSGLYPPGQYRTASEKALFQLLGPRYTDSLPPLPESLASTASEGEGSATSSDFIPLAQQLLNVAESWNGTNDEAWHGLRNLLAELGTMAALMEYRLVDRLIRDVTEFGTYFDGLETMTSEVSELAFEYVLQVANTLVSATGEEPHLPENTLNNLRELRGQLMDLVVPLAGSLETNEPIELVTQTPAQPESHGNDSVYEELLSIFEAEYASLARTLHGALSDFLELPDSAVPSDKLVAAAHTLKGVSHTVERPFMAGVFGLWEEIFKDRQSEGRALDSAEISLFQTTVTRADTCVRNIRSGSDIESGDALIEDLKGFALPASEEQESPATEIDGYIEHDGTYDEEMLSLYIEEADAELSRLDNLIGGLEDDPADEELHEEIKRLMHTLKGSSNMAGATTIGVLTHELEELLSGAEVGAFEVDDSFLKLLVTALDDLRRLTLIAKRREPLPTPWLLLSCLKSANEDEVLNAAQVNKALEESLSFGTLSSRGASQDKPKDNEPLPVESGQVYPKEANHEITESAKAKKNPAVRDKATAVKRIAPDSFEIRDNESFTQTLERLRKVRDERSSFSTTGKATPPKVKVDTELLDELIDSAFEVNVDRDRVIHYRENIERSEALLRKLINSLDGIQNSFSKELDQLDSYNRDNPEVLNPKYLDHVSALKAISRDLAETNAEVRSVQETVKDQTAVARVNTRQLTKTTRSLRENLFNTRLVPVKNLLTSLRTVTKKTGDMVSKDLSFVIEGETTLIDRNLLDALSNTRTLEHLIRNSADHGIEDKQTRIEAGKPEIGTISLKAHQDSDRIVLRICDDGAGIDPERIRQKAIEKGLIPDTVKLSDSEILQLITLSGFSTATEITQVSGRGVGMDVVRSTVENLGGSLTIASEPGKGTEFILELPYTHGVSRALVVSVDELSFAVPTGVIESFGYIDERAIEGGFIEFEGNRLPVIGLREICGLTGEQTIIPHDSRVGIVVINDAGGKFGVVCSDVAGMQSLHLKPVPFFRTSLKGVLGVADTIDGELLTVIDPRELRAVMLDNDDGQLRPKSRLLREPPRKNRPVAVVVDDSTALRKSACRFLERMGYQVFQSTNGEEALTVLDRTQAAVVVTDLEMPRMDGFELTRAIREQDKYQGLPIVMVTSRSTEEMERKALECGVNCFLPKPFNADMLEEAIGKSTTAELRV